MQTQREHQRKRRDSGITLTKANIGACRAAEIHHAEPVGHGSGYLGGSYSMMGLLLVVILVVLIILALVWVG